MSSISFFEYSHPFRGFLVGFFFDKELFFPVKMLLPLFLSAIIHLNIKDNMKDLIKGSDAKKASKWSKKAVDDIAYGGKKR